MTLKKIFLFFQKNLLTKYPTCAIISMYKRDANKTRKEEKTMNEKKYIIKYNFPHCKKHTLNDRNNQPAKMSYEQAKTVSLRLEAKYCAYTIIEEVE